jgi:hypothetical protein
MTSVMGTRATRELMRCYGLEAAETIETAETVRRSRGETLSRRG